MGELVLVVIGIWLACVIFAWVGEAIRKVRLYDMKKERLDRLDVLEAEFNKEQDEWITRVEQDREAIAMLAKEKCIGFPWLATAYADYFHLQDSRKAAYLENKERPAERAAEVTREVAAKRRNAEKLWRINRYQLEYYETLFPWLAEFKNEEVEDLVRQVSTTESDVNGNDDPARQWLTQAEYDSLTPAEKFQLALDRYWQKQKNRWEIGRDYERFIGFQYERQGWHVRYQGIVEGFADLGRDLIVSKGDRVDVVQCKHWSHYKTIHEKHVFQLYGTVIAYKIDHPEKKVAGVFVTSTKLSDRAKLFAAALKITIRDQVVLQQYPCVKCNISHKDGTKIYHLPFDQQYDRTDVDEDRSECYVASVKEAEDLGFRRAFRWRGKTSAEAGTGHSIPLSKARSIRPPTGAQ